MWLFPQDVDVELYRRRCKVLPPPPPFALGLFPPFLSYCWSVVAAAAAAAGFSLANTVVGATALEIMAKATIGIIFVFFAFSSLAQNQLLMSKTTTT